MILFDCVENDVCDRALHTIRREYSLREIIKVLTISHACYGEAVDLTRDIVDSDHPVVLSDSVLDLQQSTFGYAQAHNDGQFPADGGGIEFGHVSLYHAIAFQTLQSSGYGTWGDVQAF